jgi:hypothetical protein
MLKLHIKHRSFFYAPVPREYELGSAVIIVTSQGARRLKNRISIPGLSTVTSRPRRGSSQLRVNFVLWAFSITVKQPEFQANHSLPSRIEFRAT